MHSSSKELLKGEYKNYVKHLKEILLILVPLILISGLTMFYNYSPKSEIETPHTFILNKFPPGTKIGSFNFLVAEPLSNMCTKIYLNKDFTFAIVVCSKNLSEKEKAEVEEYVSIPLPFEGQKYQYEICDNLQENSDTPFFASELLGEIVLAIKS